MLAPLAFGQAVVVHRRAAAGRDLYGNDTPTFVDEVVHGCGFWPGSAGRNVSGARISGGESFRETSTVRAQVMLPDGVSVTADDEITLPDGYRYRADGEQQQWTSQLTGARTGVQVDLVRVDG